ncbi:MAG: DUF4157 domain-containing protein [Methylomonas sp.]|jgi:hypothetical protein|uniref:eCIS core domain-containing protein n=1 Tax=Methylomonas sp. TaxID=418 RepID=UPI0025F38C31|nr:DUF4157 domain-containing protein [Methylomonas sp.]MCK9605745.1 DUF4157 domain-containing protein [Methylomonas sp.]
MDNAQGLKRKPKTLNKAAKPATEKPVARTADMKTPGYLQAKMKVSQPGDAHEQQADQVADRVSRAPKPGGGAEKNSVHRATLQPGQDVGDPQQSLSRKPATEDKKPQSTLSRKPEQNLAKETDHKLNKKPDKPNVQAKGDALQIDQATEERINSLRGKGEPLPESVKNDMQQQLQADFSAVRIHSGGEAAGLAAGINARAFTVGNDIFFGTGEYAPDSVEGRKLLAHELTHVLQQCDGVARAEAQSPAAPATSGGGKVFEDKKLGKLDDDAKTISIPTISLPKFKEKYTPPPIKLPKKEVDYERDTKQQKIWKDNIVIAEADVGAWLTSKKAPGIKDDDTGANLYYLQLQDKDNFVTGDLQNIVKSLNKPYWDKSGNRQFYDIDHKAEVQLVGEEKADVIGNLWLLQDSINRSSGSMINNEITGRIDKLADAAAPSLWSGKKKDVKTQLRPHYSITFEKTDGKLKVKGDSSVFWEADDVNKLEPLKKLKVLKARDIKRLNLRGSPDKIAIYTSEKGGGKRDVDMSKGTEVDVKIPFGKNFTVTHVKYEKGKGGYFSGQAFRDKKGSLPALKGVEHASLENFEITETDWVDFGGYVSQVSVNRAASSVLSTLELYGLSPIEIFNAQLDPELGLVAKGQVHSDLPLLKKVPLQLDLIGDQVVLSASISADTLDFPKPFAVRASTMTLAVGSKGNLMIAGQIDFGIDRIGEGMVRASASAGKAGAEAQFALEGQFDFDSKMFDPAKVKLAYIDGDLSGEGVLGIPEHKIPGIKKATIAAKFGKNEMAASGEAELDIPGVDKGSLSVSKSEQEGFKIAGSFDLSADVPGIKSGHISAELQQAAGADEYSLKASGTAVPAIPGFDSQLRIEYDNGAIMIEGEAVYKRGMLDGRVKLGATNRALDTAGLPTGEPTPDLVVFGGGSVTVQIAPWLKGTVGVAFDPTGEVTVVGEIGLPNAVDLLPRKAVDKNLFSIGTSIPIVPGITARIKGGVDVEAGFGPGQLDQLNLGISYKPSDEQSTHITGNAHLNIPADAGIRLFVRAGIGLGIPGASASGGLEIGGKLGIAGAAEAAVDFDWTPATGLAINAEGYIHAQPKFTFDIAGFVEVEVLWKTVYEETWNFASFEYGSDLTFGVRFPIHYREGQPFDISLSDVQFETPNIDTDAILSGLIDRIA